jgi:hypothetical protein
MMPDVNYGIIFQHPVAVINNVISRGSNEGATFVVPYRLLVFIVVMYVYWCS